MSYDESQHLRDDHGRFTSGGGALGAWAKRASTGKLEGFSAGKSGDLAAWTRSKLNIDPSKATTPLEKYAASKHGIDVQLIGASKAESHIMSTGDVPFAELMAPKNSPLGMLGRMAGKAGDALTKARADEQIARNASGKAWKTLDRYEKKHNALKNEYENQQRLGLAPEVLKKKAAQVERSSKRYDKLSRAYEDANQKDTEADKATRAADARERTARLVQGVAKAIVTANVGRTDENEKHTTVNVSHDTKDGSVEIHLVGQSHDEKFPGEKSLTIRIEQQKPMGESSVADHEGSYSIVSQYPSGHRGEPHPNQVEIEGKHGGPASGKDNRYTRTTAFQSAVAMHLDKFFKS